MDLDGRLAALAAAAAEGSDLEDLCGALLDRFGVANDDDIALLVADLVPEGSP